MRSELYCSEMVKSLCYDPAERNDLPAEVTDRIATLRTAVNRDDPHYRYEFETSAVPPLPRDETGLVLSETCPLAEGGFLTIKAVAPFVQAAEERPVRGQFQVAFSVDEHPETAEDFGAFLDFGRSVQLPEGTISSFSLDLPGGLGVDQQTATGTARIGPANVVGFAPHNYRWQVVGKSGEILAETRVNVSSATRGQDGLELSGSASGGTFAVTIQVQGLPEGAQPLTASWTLNVRSHRGLLAVDIVSGVQLLGQFYLPHELFWRPEQGPSFIATWPASQTTPLLPRGYVRLIEALAFIQEPTSIPIRVPSAPSPENLNQLEAVVRVLRGETVCGSWGPSAPLVVRSGSAEETTEMFVPIIAVERELTVELDGIAIPLGPSYEVYSGVQVESVEPAGEGTARLVVRASDDAQVQVRRGRLPGSTP